MDNYLDRAGQFEDSAGTALLAAATYRVATITRSPHNIPAAERALQRVADLINADGWLSGTVDPLDFDKQATGHSPESQSFVLMLDAASRAYYATLSAKPSVNLADPANSSSWADVIAGVVRPLLSRAECFVDISSQVEDLDNSPKAS